MKGREMKENIFGIFLLAVLLIATTAFIWAMIAPIEPISADSARTAPTQPEPTKAEPSNMHMEYSGQNIFRVVCWSYGQVIFDRYIFRDFLLTYIYPTGEFIVIDIGNCVYEAVSD
jgi:hypothetical protein